MSEKLLVVIGIPTFRRPIGLARLLSSIAAQKAPFTPHVLIADNDGEGGDGLRVVKETQQKGFPFPLTSIAVPVRGISHVRNALMKTAFQEQGADLLAMIDDDETADDNWIANLVAKQRERFHDVIGGIMRPKFEQAPPRWATKLNVFYTYQPQNHFSVGSANILISRRIHDEFSNNLFDPEFGLSGSEDTEFLLRIQQRGGTIGFAPKAICFEHFGNSRLTTKWALQRSFRCGSGWGRIHKMHVRSIKEWSNFWIKLVGGVIYALLIFMLKFWSPSHSMHAMELLFRQAGKLHGLFFKPLLVYKNIHGS